MWCLRPRVERSERGEFCRGYFEIFLQFLLERSGKNIAEVRAEAHQTDKNETKVAIELSSRVKEDLDAALVVLKDYVFIYRVLNQRLSLVDDRFVFHSKANKTAMTTGQLLSSYS